MEDDQAPQNSQPPEPGLDPKPEPPTVWQRFITIVQGLEAPLVAAGKLGSVALVVSAVGWLVTSLIGYNSWRSERDLKQYEEELSQATSTFAEASNAFSKALTAQQLLAFNYVDALGSTDQGYIDFLWGQAHTTADEYRKARTELRQTIGVMTRRAEIYIDWPSADDRQTVQMAKATDPLTASNIDAITKEAIKRLSDPVWEKSKVDPLTVSDVEGDNVDCDSLVADGNDVFKWRDAPVRTGATTKVDWQSTKHHLIVLYACFLQDHVATEPIRRWATAEKTGQPPATPAFLPADAKRRKKLAENLKTHFEKQAARLDKFNILAMTRIEQIRFKDETPGYICHTTGWFCGRAALSGKPRA
jgi:hypothetical protein